MDKPTVFLLLGFCLAINLEAGRRHAVAPPSTRQKILQTCIRIVEREISENRRPLDRRAWEDGIYLMGILATVEIMETQNPGSGKQLLDRVSNVVGTGEPYIAGGNWTTYAQPALELYRLNPEKTQQVEILKSIDGPLSFAEFAVRTSPTAGPPKGWWWVEGGYGTQFWQDDMYMVIPWLAMYGSPQTGLPNNELARNLGYEWTESYIYDHRPDSPDPRERAVPTEKSRKGFFLWSPEQGLFYHDPTTLGTDNFWGRGNGWAIYGLVYATQYLDAPYSGKEYDQVMGRDELQTILRTMAASLIKRRTPDGGWGTNLSRPEECPVAETSATALLTFGLAKSINQGWLPREKYLASVKSGVQLLLGRIDGDGNISGIQPPGGGPSCYFLPWSDPNYNLNYGPGATLLALTEVLKFPDEDLPQ
jgi:rhamnogalacturonyl hydrolase YesR